MTVIRGRAPLRLGLGGGGTDVDPYSTEFGGRILNATIDRYAYAFAERCDGDTIAFRSPDRDRAGTGTFADLESLKDDFPLHVAVYRRVIGELNRGEPIPLTLATQVDAPPGSGLGSSSALVVAMLITTCELIGTTLSPYELARLAWEVERVDLGMAGGWQDHYAAAFGGFNFMENRPNEEVVVNPLRIRREVIAELEASLLLYFGGVSRLSSEVIAEQQRNVVEREVDALAATHAIRDEALEMKDLLVVGDIPGFADSLSRGWEAKKRLASRITTPAIEAAYDTAVLHGMLAGKVSGAGGGGFLMMIVDPRRRIEVTRSLERECGGTVSPCLFTHAGAETWRTPSGRKPLTPSR
ncbi:D-alpha-D-heptose-7-phosphate kinase [Mycobacterium sp. ITM-2016-00317]|uniref:GHMP family kinase ATP-binding protein n=1 Tax=Mycobacterium sp. ITM-2016-00317 TaxID=2099694 RepID=UPI00287F6EF4|nr:D-alpha-D-heptose-7-phosphate kinase [Mycobacterium sp. ITM-2016-00317]WNG90462.1 D-alpha-D-heptose-7-phosphate kinase [Mycobacterium sp. ITM-2016-00317]